MDDPREEAAARNLSAVLPKDQDARGPRTQRVMWSRGVGGGRWESRNVCGLALRRPSSACRLLPSSPAESAAGIYFTSREKPKDTCKETEKKCLGRISLLWHIWSHLRVKPYPFLAFEAQGQKQVPPLLILKYDIAISVTYMQLIGNHSVCEWDLEGKETFWKS